MPIVKIMCGSAYVKGRARRFRYMVSKIFNEYMTKKGYIVYKAGELLAGPYRSYEKLKRETVSICRERNLEFREGYGSLHNLRK